MADYKYTGKLDVEKTIREIRDTRMRDVNAKRKYSGHSKYLWRALELRNEGLTNSQIADILSAENEVTINSSRIKDIFDDCGIESNSGRSIIRDSDLPLLSREQFDKVDLENLRTGKSPSSLIEEFFDSTINGVKYKYNNQLMTIWEKSYMHYFGNTEDEENNNESEDNHEEEENNNE